MQLVKKYVDTLNRNITIMDNSVAKKLNSNDLMWL